jgi:hypothetical protein
MRGLEMAENRHETLKQRKAFEHYYGLGDDRTLRQTAKDYGVTERTVNNWSQWFEWKERVRKRDKEIGDQIDKKMIDKYSTMETDIVETLYYTMKKSVLEPFQNGEVPLEIKSVKDFETIVKMIVSFAANREEKNPEEEEKDKKLNLTLDQEEIMAEIIDKYAMGGLANDTDGSDEHTDEFEDEEDGIEQYEDDFEDEESEEHGGSA